MCPYSEQLVNHFSNALMKSFERLALSFRLSAINKVGSQIDDRQIREM